MTTTLPVAADASLHCLECGYDLRGAGDGVGATCPECGLDVDISRAGYFGGADGTVRRWQATACMQLLFVSLVAPAVPILMVMVGMVRYSESEGMVGAAVFLHELC